MSALFKIVLSAVSNWSFMHSSMKTMHSYIHQLNVRAVINHNKYIDLEICAQVDKFEVNLYTKLFKILTSFPN